MSRKGGSPLQRAAESGQLHVVQQLLNEGADVNATYIPGKAPLYVAAEAGHTAVVQLLLEAGTNVESATVIGWNPLEAAARHGHGRIVQMLLAAGADAHKADSLRDTPLHTATFCGHLDVVQLLLAAGAHVNAADEDGFTPSNLAAMGGHDHVVQLLLRKGADPQLRGGGSTALFYSAVLGHTDIVKLLLEAWGQPVVTASGLFYAAKAAADRRHMATFAYLAKTLWQLHPAKLHLLRLGRYAYPDYDVSAAAAVATCLDAWASDFSSLDEQQAAVCRREEDVAREKQVEQQLIVGMAGMRRHAEQHLANLMQHLEL